jgi:hypothetical protein
MRASLPLLRKRRSRRKTYRFSKPAVRLSVSFLCARSLRLSVVRNLVSRSLAVFYRRRRNPSFKAFKRPAGFRVLLSKYYYKLERRRFRRRRSFSRIRNFIRGGLRVTYKAGAFRRRSVRLRSLIWRGKPNFSLRLIHVRLQQYFNFSFAGFPFSLLPLPAAPLLLARETRFLGVGVLRTAAQGVGSVPALLNKNASFFEKTIAFRPAAINASAIILLQHRLAAGSLQTVQAGS